MKTVELEGLSTPSSGQAGTSSERRLHRMLEVGKIAKKEMAEVLQSYHAGRLHFIQEQAIAFVLHSRDANQVLSLKLAEFRCNHSKEIFDSTVSGPKFLSNFTDRHFGDWPEGPTFDEFVQIAKALEKYLDQDYPHVQWAWPIIASCPETLTVGEVYTIVGTKFGANRGSLYIYISIAGANTRIAPDPEILSWSDTAVMFRIPASTGSIPFHAKGALHLGQADSYQNDMVNVVVEPIALVCWDSDSSSSHGHDLLGRGYNKEITLRSGPLPPEYELFSCPYLTTTGLELYCVDNTYVPYASDDPSSISLIAGPYESGGCLEAKAKITDDWYWDYTATAVFYIMIPQGYSPAGWRTNM